MSSPMVPVVCGTVSVPLINQLSGSIPTSNEGYVLKSVMVKGKHVTVIAANSDIGVLYGTFHFLRLLQTNQNISNLFVESSPKSNSDYWIIWDNLDRTVERGWHAVSLWDWHKLPAYIDQRYIDYARANASIGNNGTVLTNVNDITHLSSHPIIWRRWHWLMHSDLTESKYI